MMHFPTVFFKGYRKKDVDAYVDSLIEEVGNYKEKINEKQIAENQDFEELKGKIKESEEESARLREQIQCLLEEQAQQKADFDKQLTESRQTPPEQEVRYEAVTRILQIAEQEAKEITTSAKTDAEHLVAEAAATAKQMTVTAQADMFHTRQNMEAELKQRKEEHEQQYMAAKFKLAEYINSINQNQSQLIETYNQLGKLVQQMPIRIEDIFSMEPFKLLNETGKADDHLQGEADEQSIT